MKCGTCGITKNKDGTPVVNYRCKECFSHQRKVLYQKDPDKYKKKAKLWRKKNPDKVKASQKKFRKKYKGMTHLAIECDMQLKAEGIYGAVFEIVKAFQKPDNKYVDKLLCELQSHDDRISEKKYGN